MNNIIKKVLIVATISRHIEKFHLSFINDLSKEGFEIHVATRGIINYHSIKKSYNINFSRSPISFNNLISYFKLKKIITSGNYDVVHTHTPVGGVVGRLASIFARKKGTKVIYTAHGFHFYKGAPILNWIFYYPIEKILSLITDTIILINNEDYNLAINKFKAKQIVLINGVGLDTNNFLFPSNFDIFLKKRSLGINPKSYVVTYVAELNKNKHQDVLIRAISNIKFKVKNLILLLVGDGKFTKKYMNLSKKLGLTKNILFLGYRTDVKEIMLSSNIVISSSRREGLPVNILEAMSLGLPIIVSDTRGNRDLIIDYFNGSIVSNDNPVEYAKNIYNFYKENRKTIINPNQKNILNKYDSLTINKELIKIYKGSS